MYSARMTALADLVREARKRAGLTQEQLDELIDKRPGYIGMLEIGRVGRPKPDTRRALAAALSLSLDDIARATGELDAPDDEDLVTQIFRIEALPTREERRAAFRELPLPVRTAIRRLMRDLFDEAAEQLSE